MTRKTIRRLVVSLALALVLGIGVTATPGLTPSASAQRPEDCVAAELKLMVFELELRALQGRLLHLLAGGVSTDEVVYVDNTLSQISALEDEITYLQSLLFRCSRRIPGPDGSDYRSGLVKVAKLKAKLAKLEADALRAKVAVERG